MRTMPTFPLPLLLTTVLFGLTACEQSPAAPAADDHLAAHASSGAVTAFAAHGDLLKAVKHQTSRFNSTVQATRAGYVMDAHCVVHPQLGGMGYHWVNHGLIDPVFDPMRPEALLYAPGKGDNYRLAGVEYIVIDVGQDHPHFDGHPFDVGGVPPLMAAGVPHWSLHVWVHLENPEGLFQPFNPRVSCD
jgi:hypothetical protein